MIGIIGLNRDIISDYLEVQDHDCDTFRHFLIKNGQKWSLFGSKNGVFLHLVFWVPVGSLSGYLKSLIILWRNDRDPKNRHFFDDIVF